MGCYQKLERDSFTSFLLILCVRAYNCGFYGSVTQIEQNRESGDKGTKRMEKKDIGKFGFFLLRKQRLLLSDNTISYKLHFAYYRTAAAALVMTLGLEWSWKRKNEEDTISPLQEWHGYWFFKDFKGLEKFMASSSLTILVSPPPPSTTTHSRLLGSSNIKGPSFSMLAFKVICSHGPMITQCFSLLFSLL